jgi:ABC-type branched-subunit amino acid transport system substrate-binding protein
LNVRWRYVALSFALVVSASACGSRLDKDELAKTNGGGGGGASAATTPSEGNTGVQNGAGGPKVGTLPLPCGKAPGGAPKAPTQPADGVTANSIKIAVISDKSGQVKVPTASVEESMQAFVDFCNSYGGINGRRLELTKIDSKLFQQLEATKQACNDKVFAIVGSGSVTDNQGAQQMIDCGLIEVPAYTATPAKALSDNLVQPIPNPSDHFNAGPPRYMVKTYPKAVKKAALLFGDIAVAATQAQRIQKAYEAAGFNFVYVKKTGIILESYTSQVEEMKSKGVEWVTMVSALSEVQKLLRDMDTQDFKPQVIDLGQQYYDPALPTSQGAEGALVQVNTAPFEEVAQNPALQVYDEAYKKVGTNIEHTTLGVQAFSAGLLFAQAAKAAGDDLTRQRVLSELKNIHSWDGGGLQMQTDPGANKVTICFLYMQVKNRKFVRFHPKKVNTFDCNPSYDYDMHDTFGGGAKLKGG